jgi:hypothetical protein
MAWSRIAVGMPSGGAGGRRADTDWESVYLGGKATAGDHSGTLLPEGPGVFVRGTAGAVEARG